MNSQKLATLESESNIFFEWQLHILYRKALKLNYRSSLSILRIATSLSKLKIRPYLTRHFITV